MTDAVEAVVRQVAEEGVDTMEVEGAIRRARRDHMAALATMEGRADELAYAATVLGDAAALPRMLDSYSSVTAADLQRVAASYLTRESAALLTVVPSGKGVGDE